MVIPLNLIPSLGSKDVQGLYRSGNYLSPLKISSTFTSAILVSP